MDNPLYAPVPEEAEATAPAPRLYLGLVFAVIFEAVFGVSAYLIHAAYQFYRAMMGAR